MHETNDFDEYDWGETNEAEWLALVRNVEEGFQRRGLLGPSVSLGSERYSPFVVDVSILNTKTVPYDAVMQVAQELRKHLRSIKENWTVEISIIPMGSALPDALWLSIDRYRVAEYLALQKKEVFVAIDDFKDAYWGQT
jgi:hypothetical protein